MKHQNLTPKLAALCTGFLLTIFISFNGILASHSDPFFSNMAFHSVGALSIGAVLVFDRLRSRFRTLGPVVWRFRPVYLLPGAIGACTVLLNNYIILEIGIVLMTTLTLLGQMLSSMVIDHFGLFGRPSVPTRPRQLLGILLMFAGIVWMVAS
ncbi:MAG: DMT family transporter [Bacillota bacterium]|nr:DMT family transporter [Bacillota bacterium]